MLLGEFDTSIGEKNRVAIPKKLRDELKSPIFLTRGYDGCLILIDSKRWHDFIASIEKQSLLSLDVRDSKRYIIGGAQEITVDNQGRFVLPNNLIEFANLENNIVFLGIKDWVEIWSKELWDQKFNNLNNSVSDIAERLSQL